MKSNRGFAAVPVLLVIAILVAVGAYFAFRGGTLRQPSEERAFQLELEEITSQSSSDEVSAIEEDLQATSFTEVDSDLAKLEAELDAALQSN